MNVYMGALPQQRHGAPKGAVAEASGCGLPALISDKFNIWYEVQSSGARLVAADTPRGTVKLLDGWLSMTPTEQARWAVLHARFSSRRFTRGCHGEGLLDVVKQYSADPGM